MYNIARIEDILAVMEDCIYKLDLFCKSDSYHNTNDVAVKIFMEEGFRGYIRAFQEQLIKYLSHMSRGLYDRKDKLGYKDIISKHKDANQLDNVSADFLLELRKGRNYIAHGYEHPDFQVIYEFFNRYRSEFDNVINCVRKTISQSQYNQIKETRKTEEDLYTSLEVARKLIEILGNDGIPEIALKTGLDIEVVKSLATKI